ncbi:EamA family transporter [Streptomyces sp. TRM 70351]|uniref:EamA family transporter n=1 Tax=Streptomyces sp. TRM 70351 TaxID=3116552 RepID=UPI002E7B08B1|nr:EamA family transporter [Streptomyces sp. TRM 70351]MEE1927863.1 EamA family transporter [Streptomyces sp. TRM 70351]
MAAQQTTTSPAPPASPEHRPRRLSERVPAPLLVVGSVIGIQVGQAFGKQMFGAVGPFGVVTLRLVFAAVILLALWRPRLPSGWRERGLVMALGTAIAGMNVVYLALRHLDVGVAVTLQFLGPLVLALAGSRRLLDLVWGALAWLGVALFADPFGGGHGLPLIGLVYGLVSAAAMAAYVVLNKRAGTRSLDGSYLAYAVAFAALLSLPTGIGEGGTALLEPGVLLAGLGVAVLSAAIPYSLDLAALRRLPARTVAVLESLEPAVAGLAAILVLSELLNGWQWLAIACVTVASLGAVLTPAKRPAGRRGGRRARRTFPQSVLASPHLKGKAFPSGTRE